MADKKNQHFVPQFYFKNFSGGKPYINLMSTENGRIISNAGIKGQCARSYFYGPKENEEIISGFEQHVKAILDGFIKIKTDNDFQKLYERDDFTRIYFAVLFQRLRTEREVLKVKRSTDEFTIETFKHYLENREGTPDIIKNNMDKINSKNMKIQRPLAYYFALHFDHLYTSTNYLIDLGIHVLKNKTSIPFIFGDSPVVFYNQYYREVKKRGVIGLQTPGLMIFFPLSPDTVLLLLDENVYECPWSNNGIYEISEDFDVKHINKLQLHNALKTVYFPESMPHKTILTYWKQEKNNLKPPQSGISKDPVYVAGILRKNVMLTMDSQIPYILKLSFINSDVIDDSQYQVRRRCPEIHEFVKELETGNFEDAIQHFKEKFSLR